MCRYLAYRGSPLPLEELVYRPTNSLVHQASDAMESPTRINANLGSLAGKVSSGCILAHVRAARRFDPVARNNCHPFQHHRLLWMHNVDVPGRVRLHRRVVVAADDALVARIRGNTDTELAFTLFLGFLEPPLDRAFDAEELGRALRQTVERIVDWQSKDGDERPTVLNFCVTDGESMAATRYARNAQAPSLHYATGARFVCEDRACCLEPANGDPGCLILSSECLFEGADWQTVAPGGLVLVRKDLQIERLWLDPE